MGTVRSPSIGRLVQSFWNATSESQFGRKLGDATEDNSGDTVLRSAATNMTMLRRAALSRIVLSTTILESLASYSHLRDLHLHGIYPAKCHWKNSILPLTKLSWELPSEFGFHQPWNAVTSVLEAALDTCPELVGLNISSQRYCVPDTTSVLKLPSRYPSLSQTKKGLMKLQQLAFRGDFIEFDRAEYNSGFLADLQTFIYQHRKSLKSLTMPIDPEYLPRNLEWVLQACTGLLELTSITLLCQLTSSSLRSYNYLS